MNKNLLISIAISIGILAIAAFIFFSNKNTSSSSPQTSATSTQSSGKTYTLAEVAMHKDQTSCWSAIDGKVYDLTNWISKHPGGPQRILSICGTDGSSAFNKKHDGQSKPEQELTNFYIGDLAS